VVLRSIVALNVLLVLLVAAQIGLGYSTRNNVPLVAWHIPNGVLLMGTCTVLAPLAWSRKASPTHRPEDGSAFEAR